MKTVIMILACMAAMPSHASEAVIAQVQDTYHSDGAGAFSTEHGKGMWTQTFKQQKSGKPVSCATCHTADIRQRGAHVRTGKIIEPMAASANAEGLNDPKKIEKWFLRNCKWTMGRECTAQEKGNFLAYFLSE